jgi:site-specific DNA-adenine methylase
MTKGLFAYYVGKAYLVKDIMNVIEPIRNDIRCFVDVFGGSGRVLLNVPDEWNIKIKVYNDIDLKLANIMRDLQNKNKREAYEHNKR